MNSVSSQSTSDRALAVRAAQVGELMKDRALMLATAESCTGGWLAKVLTDNAGSSNYYCGGVVSYANQLKEDLLAVPALTLARAGAVSQAVVASMASGVLRLTGADMSIAISGIAGPAGGTGDKPVGTVCLAWAGPAGVLSERCHFDGNREAVRRRATDHALRRFHRLLTSSG